MADKARQKAAWVLSVFHTPNPSYPLVGLAHGTSVAQGLVPASLKKKEKKNT
jgi:hypothetical protein